MGTSFSVKPSVEMGSKKAPWIVPGCIKKLFSGASFRRFKNTKGMIGF